MASPSAALPVDGNTGVSQDAALISQLRDRSKIALQNADVRKRKATLNTRILGLDNLIKKGKTTKAIVAERHQRVRVAPFWSCMHTLELWGQRHYNAVQGSSARELQLSLS